MNTSARDLREVFADLVVGFVVFAELGDEDELHPDSAVKWLETIVVGLRQLGASDRLWLYEHVKARPNASHTPIIAV